MLFNLFLFFQCCEQIQRISSVAVPRVRYPRESGVITLADGQKLTGLNIHLSVPNLSQIKAYFGIRYASLGTAHLSPLKRPGVRQSATTSVQFDTLPISNLSKTGISVPASPHRFSHSVASFFYEAPSGVHAKTILPPVCPQPDWNQNQIEMEFLQPVRNRLLRLEPFLREQSEDCLTLNIYVPQTTYPFAAQGFLSLKEGQSNGNFALFDLHAAILWLRNNVASFGGDPEQITIMGYRHGAALVHLFSLSKMAQGIGGKGIKRIILMDGSGLAPWAISTREDWLMSELASQLNVTSAKPNKDSENRREPVNPLSSSTVVQTSAFNNLKPNPTKSHVNSTNETIKYPSVSEQLIKLLKALPIDEILRIQKNLKIPPFITLLGPVASHHLFPGFLTNQISPEAGAQKSAEHFQFQNMRSSRSTTYLESTLFSQADLMVCSTQLPALDVYKHSQWHDRWTDSLLNFSHALYPSNWKSITDLLEFVYMKTYRKELSDRNTGSTYEVFLEKALELLSDGLFLSPTVQTIQLHHALKILESKHRGSVAGVHATATSANPEPISARSNAWIKQNEGLAYYLGAPLVSPNRLDPFVESYSEADKRISFKILQFLTNFIHSGNPNKPNIWPSASKPSVYWPEYDDKTESYLSVGLFENRKSWEIKRNGDEDLMIKHAFREKELAIWSHLLPRIAGLGPDPESHTKNRSENGDTKQPQKKQNETTDNLSECSNSETWAPNAQSYEAHLYWLNLRQRQRHEDEASLNASMRILENTITEMVFHRERIRENRSFFFRLSHNSHGENPAQEPLQEEESAVIDRGPVQVTRLQDFTQPGAHRQQSKDNNTMTTRSALLWTITVGSVLFLLNALVFMGIYYQARHMRCNPLQTITVSAKTNRMDREDTRATPDDKGTTGCYGSKKSKCDSSDHSGLQGGNLYYGDHLMDAAQKCPTSPNPCVNENPPGQNASLRHGQPVFGSVRGHQTLLLTNHGTAQEAVNWGIQPPRFGLNEYERFGIRYT
ncbi:unnamed protein product [Echinostoma caproni]|uniref:COesterase domain-containing protein n=1 Tax=Echinostoma caproni TaxID=27848 RepID=A0A183ACE4_9TREM|nr:unnamed protein product [Echinostoma caproni]